jgi:hypothetical protein
MWSLTSPRAKRINGPKKFRSSPKKDFFNAIGQKQTSSLLPRISASIQKADMQKNTLLKELTRKFEPRWTRSSKRDSNPRNLAVQVVAATLDLPELY